MNQRKRGTEKEETACAYLTSKGVQIIQRNYRVRIGEVDIIAMDGDVLCFIEVKYRKTDSPGISEEAVNQKKQRIICKVSDYYRMQYKINLDTQIRYDVVAINEKEINWIRDAFLYCGSAYQ